MKLNYPSIFIVIYFIFQPSLIDAVAATQLREDIYKTNINRELPEWFLQNRAHAHTRLSLKWENKKAFLGASDFFEENGAKVIIRHFKTGNEDPWWPSNVPVDKEGRPVLAKHKDLASKIIESAHDHGLKIIAYYWHMSDKRISDAHPEWVCHKANGKEMVGRRGTYIDLTTKYKDIVLIRLFELAKRGVDGFYFDSLHMPRQGCRGSKLETDYRVKYGIKSKFRQDLKDDDYRHFIDYQALKIEETFEYWESKVKEKYPNVVFLISMSSLPALMNNHVRTNLANIADSPKSEFYTAINKGANYLYFKDFPDEPEAPKDIRMAVGWMLLRDSAEGRAPHIWSAAFNDINDAYAFSGALFVYGSIADIDINENIIEKSMKGGVKNIEISKVFEMGRKVGQILKNTKPLKWAAVLYSERARNNKNGDLKKIWHECLIPLYSEIEAFVRNGLPVDIINDNQITLDNLSQYKIISIGSRNDLSQSQKQVLENYHRNGGVIIETENHLKWSDRSEIAKSKENIYKIVEKNSESAPIQVTGLPVNVHAVSYLNDDGKVIVGITNDFTWIQTERELKRNKKRNKKPGKVTGIKILISNNIHPSNAIETMTGKKLKIVKNSKKSEIIVPDFNVYSFIEIN